MPVIQGQIDPVEDDFWTERLPFFTAHFPTYYREPQQVHGRIHTSNEHYFDGSFLAKAKTCAAIFANVWQQPLELYAVVP